MIAVTTRERTTTQLQATDLLQARTAQIKALLTVLELVTNPDSKIKPCAVTIHEAIWAVNELARQACAASDEI